jgi:acetolactate synthase-1/2/3 large subunit
VNYTGGRILVEVLRQQGVDRIFCVPGESYLAVLDALVDAPEIAVITCRQEGGAAMMAEAHARITGRPGVCFVTRGPGATNASAGIHIAQQDSTPLIVFVGQIERSAIDREAFQELDYRAVFGSMTKWVSQIDDVKRIPEMVGRAFYTAMSGRPGPVLLALPEDMLVDTAPVPTKLPPYQVVEAGFKTEDLESVQTLLAGAKQPLAIIGGGGWTAEACDAMVRFSEAWALPVATSFRAQDHFNNAHMNYVGDVGLRPNPVLADAIRDADVLLVIGARLGEATTNGYTLINLPVPRQKMIHIHASAEELGSVYQPALAINAGMGSATKALATLRAPNAAPWESRTKELRKGYLTWTTPKQIPGELQMGTIMEWLRDNLSDDAIIANGAGNFAIWPNRFYRYRKFTSMLAPTCGSMGYGLPAAIAAKLQFPERHVICFAGDGDLMMSVQEMATAAMYGAAVVVLLVNNNMFGTIRMHQERDYPHRISSTSLVNPNFVDLAKSFGAYAERVSTTAEFVPAFERAIGAGRLALLELVIDPEAMTPDVTITGLRNRPRT